MRHPTENEREALRALWGYLDINFAAITRVDIEGACRESWSFFNTNMSHSERGTGKCENRPREKKPY